MLLFLLLFVGFVLNIVAFLSVKQATKASCANMDVRIGVEIIEKALR